MTTTAITVPLDATSAAAYQSASREHQHKIRLMVRLIVHEFSATSPQRLKDVMDEIGAKAVARGMTPERLEQLLNDDSHRT
jgi:hypothetical protein